MFSKFLSASKRHKSFHSAGVALAKCLFLLAVLLRQQLPATVLLRTFAVAIAAAIFQQFSASQLGALILKIDRHFSDLVLSPDHLKSASLVGHNQIVQLLIHNLLVNSFIRGSS